ncbi:MAG: pentapeptide repeat-containing protein [Bacteroidia bacterium]
MLIQDKSFSSGDFQSGAFQGREYENCTFSNCDFSGVNFSGIIFSGCTFNSCNLSLIKTDKTAFRNIVFRDCKMLGIRFDLCNEFGLSFTFENCILNHSSFYKRKIRETTYKNVSLQEVDFSFCDLTNSVLNNCDLLNAAFSGSILEKCDLRSAYNYSIDPELNKIKKAKFSRTGIDGLLHKYDISIE